MTELVWHGKHIPGRDPSSGQSGLSLSRLRTQESYSPTPTTEQPLPALSDAALPWHNRLIHADKQALLPVLLEDFANTVNLIYIDPPFMTGRTFTQGNQVAYRDTWRNSLDHYLQWIYETFIFLHQLLTPDGSLYVHLDWRTAHYAKLLLDEIFSAQAQTKGAGFKNEIIWHYQSGGRAKKYYARKHDTILLYTKSAHYCFHGEQLGEKRGTQKRNHMRKEIGEDGRTFWTIRSGGRVYRYDEDQYMSLPDVWSDISHLHQKDPERTGYATQKPEALLERILLASSNENDLILDCFCGSGVTPIVAERLGRRWIASDQSEQAISTTRARLLLQQRQRPFLFQHLETSTR
ncbi:MAG TPA: site-specific DNA-methyltransferase [Ktedonobacteraceae bacterium]|jgi:site-specific DNA-methyltransferase (adenine-specific)/adenine-specific DNA-methyltransferase|nr:site-specific DNA-methyltransferase [Ktedonobacteraceae bacterium]